MTKEDDAKQDQLQIQHGVKPARNVGTSNPAGDKGETPTEDLPEVDLDRQRVQDPQREQPTNL